MAIFIAVMIMIVLIAGIAFMKSRIGYKLVESGTVLFIQNGIVAQIIQVQNRRFIWRKRKHIFVLYDGFIPLEGSFYGFSLRDNSEADIKVSGKIWSAYPQHWIQNYSGMPQSIEASLRRYNARTVLWQSVTYWLQNLIIDQLASYTREQYEDLEQVNNQIRSIIWAFYEKNAAFMDNINIQVECSYPWMQRRMVAQARQTQGIYADRLLALKPNEEDSFIEEEGLVGVDSHTFGISLADLLSWRIANDQTHDALSEEVEELAQATTA